VCSGGRGASLPLKRHLVESEPAQAKGQSDTFVEGGLADASLEEVELGCGPSGRRRVLLLSWCFSDLYRPETLSLLASRNVPYAIYTKSHARLRGSD